MLVGIVAPRRAVGQSVTTINLTAKLTQMIKRKALIIDFQQNHDIAHYLSDSQWTRGLDEFKTLLDSGMLQNPIHFNKCVKAVNPMIDIMDANRCFTVSLDDIKALLEMVRSSYPITLIHMDFLGTPGFKEILRQVQAIIMVMDQNKRAIQCVKHQPMYLDEKDKISFVINRWMDHYTDEVIRYNAKEIKKDLKNMGFINNEIYRLPFDPYLLNECNDNSILNYAFHEIENTQGYNRELERMAKCILTQGGGFSLEENEREDKGVKSVFRRFLNPRRNF